MYFALYGINLRYIRPTHSIAKMQYEVIIDTGETPNKCTIAPLHSRPDFKLFRVNKDPILGPLRSEVLLHHQGQCLSAFSQSSRKVSGVAAIDCVWRRLDGLIRRIEGPVPELVRIPEGFRTAYPRRSVLNTDPAGGLATIEAIFVASALLGKWDVSLLSEYYFGRRFVEMNLNRFLELGVSRASEADALPVLPSRPRHSLQRRRDRGKA